MGRLPLHRDGAVAVGVDAARVIEAVSVDVVRVSDPVAMVSGIGAQRRDDRDGDDDGDDAEGDERRQVHLERFADEEHLDADEGEDHAETRR